MSTLMQESRPVLVKQQWRQVAWITVGSIALFLGFRKLPTGTNLSHMDFRPAGQNSIETCDPTNPQFIPVVAMRSPVVMTLTTLAPAAVGREVRAAITMKTSSGKPIAPEDLLVMHTRKLHLLIADPTLTDYQHVHPEPARTPGDWEFHFTPRLAGAYRIFADFTPVATGRGLYANADLDVAAAPGSPPTEKPPMVPNSWRFESDGYRFELQPSVPVIHTRQPVDLKFLVTNLDGGAVPMEPVMGAFAHLVAFDDTRSGFAHLHPMELDLLKPPDSVRPTLTFKITIPNPGHYVIWSQVNLGGREIFAPFWFDVAP